MFVILFLYPRKTLDIEAVKWDQSESENKCGFQMNIRSWHWRIRALSALLIPVVLNVCGQAERHSDA